LPCCDENTRIGTFSRKTTAPHASSQLPAEPTLEEKVASHVCTSPDRP
jgi:hypothetical protein